MSSADVPSKSSEHPKPDERFAQAVAAGFAQFFGKYGLTKRFVDRGFWKEREIYANDDFLVSIVINYDPRDAGFEIWFWPADALDLLAGTSLDAFYLDKKPNALLRLLVGPAGQRRQQAMRLQADNLFDVMVSHGLQYDGPPMGRHGMIRPGGMESMLRKLNEVACGIGNPYFAKFRRNA